MPRVAEEAEHFEKPLCTEKLECGGETILLVEDEPGVRNLAVIILNRLGYKVIQAADGGKALMLAGEYKEPIALLMTDVIMPEINGRQLAERLKEIHPEMKVLFTSGYTEDIITQHGVVEESMNFIGKPYTIQQLARKLREVLSGK